MNLAIGMLLYLAVCVFGMWLDLTYRVKSPSFFFGLGVASMMPLFWMAISGLLL